MTPGTGERSARRGLVHQDRYSARVIYDHIDDPAVIWFGLADRKAGKFDDFVIAYRDVIVAHQFKKSLIPKPIGLTALLLGKDPAITELAASYTELRRQFPDLPLRLRYLDNSPPSRNDLLVGGEESTTTAALLEERAAHPDWTLAEWAASRWAPLINKLHTASRLPPADFEAFWGSLEIVLGDEAQPVLDPEENEGRAAQIEELAAKLSAIIDDHGDQDRWTPSEMLQALGWQLRSGRQHRFPIAPHAQRNRLTEYAIDAALTAVSQGYVALIGTPGSGKSTFLERELRSLPGRVDVIRYLAFVPREAQGQGRGEAQSFLGDINRQLRDIGLASPRKRDVDRAEALDSFGTLLAQAGIRYIADGRRVDIVVDGLDHVPREEHPKDSFLSVLPLPSTIPGGVRFILGTQRLDGIGLRPAVIEQAGARERRVDIAPLTDDAINRLCNELELSDDVDRREVRAAGRGHPLVSRYLIEQLKVADEEGRRTLLKGASAYGGDVEEVYRSALRGVREDAGGRALRRVLAYLSRANGLIEPSLLAQAAGSEAVDEAWRQAGHLLRVVDGRWEVFHNSFRLFLRAVPVLRFGQPDPEFNDAALYDRLADLSHSAPPDSPQRWLEFRYAFLSGDKVRARALASRAYFIRQYVDGRAAEAISGDIRDAYQLHIDDPDGSAQLFELMMTQDEIYRREWVMESAQSLVDANLALNDLPAAETALESTHPAGKEWLVVDALLAAGQHDRARALFEAQDAAHGLRELAPPRLASQVDGVREWIARAVLFLDDEQLRRRLDLLTTSEGIDLAQDGFDRSEFHADLRLSVARALIRERMVDDVSSLMRAWNVAERHCALLTAEFALSSLSGDDLIRRTLNAINTPGFEELHQSWRAFLARDVARTGDLELSRTIAADLSIEGLAVIDPPGHSERAADTTRTMARHVILFKQLGLPMPELAQAKQRLLRGAQSHVLALAEVIGLARADSPLPSSEAWRRSSGAMRFVTMGHQASDDDMLIGHLMSPVLEELVALAFDALPLATGDLAAEHDRLLAEYPHGFGSRPSLRRQIALRQFQNDGDKVAALRRLNSALAVLDERDPQSEIEERTQFAIAFAEVGDGELARGLLAELRTRALGIYAPAKKDGQYELWSTVLALANAADPARRGERCKIALRLVDGLEQTEGAGMGGRIARQILFEASATSSQLGWSAAKAAMATGYASWDGIVDAVLRGIASRSPELLEVALRTWCYLALPWYGEPHGSTVDNGQFLKDIIARASKDEVANLMQIAVDAIERYARPALRRTLLESLCLAIEAKGVAAKRTISALERWPAEVREDEAQRSDHRYDAIDTLPAALAALRRGSEADDSGWEADFALRRRIAVLVAERPWTEVQSFVAEYDCDSDGDITLAIAKRAIAEGDLVRAQATLDTVNRRHEGGWSFDRGRGRLHFHQLRHAIGAADAFEVARADFIGDLVEGRYGVSTSMWDVDTILPVLFRQIDWPRIWDTLSDQLEDYRDYKLGRAIVVTASVDDDETLIVELITTALTLSASTLQGRAMRNVQALVPLRSSISARIIDNLVIANGDGAVLAARLLCLTVEEASVRARFISRLPQLVADEDLAVVLAAQFLATMWGVDFDIDPMPLPPLYSLHLPELDEAPGVALLGGGEAAIKPWQRLVKALARASGVDPAQVGRRASQLADIELVGQTAEAARKALEIELGRIGLKIAYHKPAAVIALRALRCVAAELLRAGCIPPREISLVAHQLHVDPQAPRTLGNHTRPAEIAVPVMPRMMWGKEQDEWLDAVEDDLSGRGGLVLCEWSRQTVREIRRSAISERWLSGEDAATDSLDAWLASLPQVVGMGGLLPLYREDEIDSSRCARLQSGTSNPAEADLLIFCPLSARSLGWAPTHDTPTAFVDEGGKVMARTIAWVDGIEQPVDEDERSATGQRVLLSEEGWRQMEARFGGMSGVEHVCRCVKSHEAGAVDKARHARSSLDIN